MHGRERKKKSNGAEERQTALDVVNIPYVSMRPSDFK